MTGKGRVAQVITEDNFAQFVKAHELGKAGDIAGAVAFLASPQASYIIVQTLW